MSLCYEMALEQPIFQFQYGHATGERVIVINTSFNHKEEIPCDAPGTTIYPSTAPTTNSYETDVFQEGQITRKRQFTEILVPTDHLTKLPLPESELRIASSSCLVNVSCPLMGSFTIHNAY